MQNLPNGAQDALKNLQQQAAERQKICCRAQRDLQRHRVLFLCLDQAGHRAVNAPQGLLLRRLHYQLYRVGEALVLLLHLRQQADAVFQRRRVHGQL